MRAEDQLQDLGVILQRIWHFVFVRLYGDAYYPTLTLEQDQYQHAYDHLGFDAFVWKSNSI